MMRPLLSALALLGFAAVAHAGPPATGSLLLAEEPASRPPVVVGSALASELAPRIAHGSAEVPQDWLAQRTIDREWGASEDSLYREIVVPGWKSEPLALSLSGVLPGAGELYVGEGSGWLFVAVEAFGWVGRTVTRRKADDLRQEAASFVGDPTDSSSTWSFERYAELTGSRAAELEALWVGDREAFYHAIATDASYRAGFKGSDPSVTYESYRGLREDSQQRMRQSRYYEITLWANHVLSAFDALRAARFHNLPLRRNIDLQLGARIRRGDPTLRAAVVRRF